MKIEMIVNGMEYSHNKLQIKPLTVLMTIDERGQTISIDNDKTQFSISLKPIFKAITDNVTSVDQLMKIIQGGY